MFITFDLIAVLSRRGVEEGSEGEGEAEGEGGVEGEKEVEEVEGEEDDKGRAHSSMAMCSNVLTTASFKTSTV